MEACKTLLEKVAAHSTIGTRGNETQKVRKVIRP